MHVAQVHWDDGVTGTYRVGASLNGAPVFELEFASIPVPRSEPVANRPVTCITLPINSVGLKVTSSVLENVLIAIND